MFTLETSRERERARLADLLARCLALPEPRPFMRDGCMYGVQTIRAQVDVARRTVASPRASFHDFSRVADGLRAAYSLPL